MPCLFNHGIENFFKKIDDIEYILKCKKICEIIYLPIVIYVVKSIISLLMTKSLCCSYTNVMNDGDWWWLMLKLIDCCKENWLQFKAFWLTNSLFFKLVFFIDFHYYLALIERGTLIAFLVTFFSFRIKLPLFSLGFTFYCSVLLVMKT